MVIKGGEKCEKEGERDVERVGRRSIEKIYLERESFSLPARGMTHLLPADRRMDGGKEGGDGQRQGGERV